MPGNRDGIVLYCEYNCLCYYDNGILYPVEALIGKLLDLLRASDIQDKEEKADLLRSAF